MYKLRCDIEAENLSTGKILNVEIPVVVVDVPS